MDKDIKQVIVMRSDLKCRKGKEIAQGAHSATAWLVDLIRKNEKPSKVQQEWMDSTHKKVVVQVDSEEELLKLFQTAKDAGLTSFLVEDLGLTEFNGVKTKTCIAIGPDYSEKIDPVTSHLKLR